MRPQKTRFSRHGRLRPPPCPRAPGLEARARRTKHATHTPLAATRGEQSKANQTHPHPLNKSQKQGLVGCSDQCLSHRRGSQLISKPFLCLLCFSRLFATAKQSEHKKKSQNFGQTLRYTMCTTPETQHHRRAHMAMVADIGTAGSWTRAGRERVFESLERE